MGAGRPGLSQGRGPLPPQRLLRQRAPGSGKAVRRDGPAIRLGSIPLRRRLGLQDAGLPLPLEQPRGRGPLGGGGAREEGRRPRQAREGGQGLPGHLSQREAGLEGQAAHAAEGAVDPGALTASTGAGPGLRPAFLDGQDIHPGRARPREQGQAQVRPGGQPGASLDRSDRHTASPEPREARVPRGRRAPGAGPHRPEPTRRGPRRPGLQGSLGPQLLLPGHSAAARDRHQGQGHPSWQARRRGGEETVRERLGGFPSRPLVVIVIDGSETRTTAPESGARAPLGEPRRVVQPRPAARPRRAADRHRSGTRRPRPRHHRTQGPSGEGSRPRRLQFDWPKWFGRSWEPRSS